MDQETLFEEFNEKRKERLKIGLKKYGDVLVNKDDLVVDIEEELLDLANYAYLLYTRIQNFRNLHPGIRGVD